MDKMIYCSITDNIKCPKCGSYHVYVKSGIMTDLYICMDCSFESRDIEMGRH